ncbi:MAG TPA: ABC transporter permease [Chloroflexi bacterium]|nr:ABC transporter permease [Chloroflexota bacterium]
MIKYLIRRFLWLVPVFFTVALVTFVLMHAAPGGPWDTDPMMRKVDPRTEAVLNRRYGLDKPLWQQFLDYVWNAAQGKLGPSYRLRGRQVEDVLRERFPTTAKLGLLALAMAIVVGLPLGVIAALRQNTWVDYFSLFFATVGTAVPSFVLGIFLIIIFASWLHWVTVLESDWSSFKPWILPAVVLGVGTAAYIARLSRSSMLEVIRQDYVRTARAKGLSERAIILQHMLQNALIPVVTILGPALANLITGSFIIETLFRVPGMGRLYVTAINQRDYSMIMGTTLFYAVIIALTNLGVDITYGFLDPRIKASE